MNFSPPFDFHSTFPLPPYSPHLHDCHIWPFSLGFDIPNSNFDDFLEFDAKCSPTFACEEPSEDGPRSNTESASGSASSTEEAQPCLWKSGRRSRGGGPRKKSNDSLYKGIRKRQEGKWVSEIREPGKKSRIWLGTFPTPEMAARAYDVAAFNLKAPYTYLNFPEAVSSLPVPLSRSPKHIQAAASMAAEAFRGAASNSHAARIGGLVPTSSAVDQTSTLPMPMQEQKRLLPQSSSPPTTESPFFDEEMIFNMPNVLADMAQGLVITPPLLYQGTDADDNYNNSGHGAESFLWNI